MKKIARLIFSVGTCISLLFAVGCIGAVTFSILKPVVSNLIENHVVRFIVLAGGIWFVTMVVLLAILLSLHGYYWRIVKLKVR